MLEDFLSASTTLKASTFSPYSKLMDSTLVSSKSESGATFQTPSHKPTPPKIVKLDVSHTSKSDSIKKHKFGKAKGAL